MIKALEATVEEQSRKISELTKIVRGKNNTIRPSAGSKAGVHYVAADNARIRNEGEAAFHDSHNEESCTFQIAAVNKVLCAVSYFATTA